MQQTTRRDARIPLQLNLVTHARTATTSSLELATRRTHVGARLASRRTRSSEVSHGLASTAVALQQHRVGSGGSTQSQLVQSDALASSLQNASTSGLSEAESAHLQGGHLDHANIVSDGSNDHGDLVLLSLHVLHQSAQTHGRAVDAAHVEALQDHLGESSIGAASQEAVQLRDHPFLQKALTLTSRAKYTFSLLGACLFLCPQLRPPATRSIPYKVVTKGPPAQIANTSELETYHIYRAVPSKEM